MAGPIMDLRGRRVLVTGASSGIGRAVARRIAPRGAALAVTARRKHLLDEVADAIAATGADRPTVLAADLSVPGAARELADRATDALGGVDVLVNNAGGGVGGSQWATADGAPAREAFEINYWSPVALTAALVPPMRSRGDGAVVNLTSAAQVVTWPTFGGYAATKAALASATETLRLELAGSGVSVTEVVVGPVDTAVQGETRLIPGIGDMLDRVYGGRLGDPDELAGLIVAGIERRRPRIVYPRRTWVAYALPGLARRSVARAAERSWSRLDPGAREGLLALEVRTGSMGDDVAVWAREEWERQHARQQ